LTEVEHVAQWTCQCRAGHAALTHVRLHGPTKVAVPSGPMFASVSGEDCPGLLGASTTALHFAIRAHSVLTFYRRRVPQRPENQSAGVGGVPTVPFYVGGLVRSY